jgi:phage shock protein A
MADAVPLYAVPIHHAVDKGDLEEMRKLADEAEQHLADYGDVKEALEKLKAEISRLEAGL